MKKEEKTQCQAKEADQEAPEEVVDVEQEEALVVEIELEVGSTIVMDSTIALVVGMFTVPSEQEVITE